MKKELLGVKVDDLTWEEVEKVVINLVKQGKLGNYIVRPNAEIITYAQKDFHFKNILNNANLAIPDGVGVLQASGMLNIGLKGRFGGPESMLDIVKLANDNSFSIYLLGSEEKVVARVAQSLQEQFKNLKVAGYHSGYFTDNQEVVSEINQAKPNIIFVGMGFPKQENWIWDNKEQLKVNLLVTEGGSFDYLAKIVKRAPIFIRKIGFDWLFRLITQPWRLKRQLALIKFSLLVIKEKFWA